MPKGYSISIASDTKAFATGVQKGIIEPLEDAADIIQDIGSDGPRDLDKLERAMKDAQAETDDVQKAFSELQQQIRETGRKSKTDFADPMNRSSKEVSSQLDEVEREGKANAAELFSSFDGSFESIADAAQGTLGGLVGGLKGIPAIAAVAAGAAGLGLVSSAIITQTEQAEDLKQAITDAYRSAAEEGRTFIDAAAVDAAALDILFDAGKREAATAEAARLGVDRTTYIRALAGDADALNEALTIGQTKLGPYQDAVNNAFGFGSLKDVDEELLVVVQKLQEIERIHNDNEIAAEGYLEVVAEGARAEREQNDRVRSAEQERFEALGRSYTEAAGRAPISIRTELQQPDIDALRRGTQGSFERTPVKVRATLVNREGKEVYG